MYVATYANAQPSLGGSFPGSQGFQETGRRCVSQDQKECPEIKWLHSFATLGRFDVVDIVESPDVGQIEKAAMIIRAYGHATTKTLLATPWKDFLKGL